MRMKTQRAAVQRRMEAKEKEFRWGALLFQQQQRHSFCSFPLQIAAHGVAGSRMMATKPGPRHS
jgi:hypothetical protein